MKVNFLNSDLGLSFLLPFGRGSWAWKCFKRLELQWLWIRDRRRLPNRWQRDQHQWHQILCWLYRHKGGLGASLIIRPIVRRWFVGGQDLRCCWGHSKFRRAYCLRRNFWRLQHPKCQRWFLRFTCQDLGEWGQRNRCKRYSFLGLRVFIRLGRPWRFMVNCFWYFWANYRWYCLGPTILSCCLESKWKYTCSGSSHDSGSTNGCLDDWDERPEFGLEDWVEIVRSTGSDEAVAVG